MTRTPRWRACATWVSLWTGRYRRSPARGKENGMGRIPLVRLSDLPRKEPTNGHPN